VSFSAPGKLFLAGEYAVLAGGTAVVAAVDRRAVARFVPRAAPSSPLIAEAVKAVHQHCEVHALPLVDGAPEVDSSALNENGRKLGLGSSAAATVAVPTWAGRCGSGTGFMPAASSAPAAWSMTASPRGARTTAA